jgi:cytidine deaminase
MDGPEDLLAAAMAVWANAYAPYSRYKVAAALRTAKGRIHAGVNVENASYPVGTCAEAGAIAAMVAAGETSLTEIVVIADGGIIVTPCGGCRQRIIEFGGRKATIWAADLRGYRCRFTADEMLPLAFGPDTMTESSPEATDPGGVT